MEVLRKAGAAGFTDDGIPILNEEVFPPFYSLFHPRFTIIKV